MRISHIKTEAQTFRMVCITQTNHKISQSIKRGPQISELADTSQSNTPRPYLQHQDQSDHEKGKYRKTVFCNMLCLNVQILTWESLGIHSLLGPASGGH